MAAITTDGDCCHEIKRCLLLGRKVMTNLDSIFWSFSFSISPSNEYSGLISFRMDWFDLAVQGTLKSLLQHHSLKASILRHSAFFLVQLSHPYMTTGKIIALTLLFNMLSRLVITFLPRSKHLLISWLQSLQMVIAAMKLKDTYSWEGKL